MDKEGEKLNKIQYGLSKGAFVTLQNDSQNSRVFIAEGVETALSVREAGVEGRVVASLGIHNLKNYERSEHKIVICADNDGLHARTHEVIYHAQEYFQTQGKHVVVIRPHKEGQDFNDVLKEGGAREVREYVCEQTLHKTEPFKNKLLEEHQKISETAQHIEHAPQENQKSRGMDFGR